MSVAKIKGFSDLFAPESNTFTYIEEQARAVFFSYGFTELRTPIMERTELFKRSIGEDTDVVHKEMYTLTTESGKSYSLRPEATAGVMRAYIEKALNASTQVARLFTTGPMFRHERPQKGRLRQFHQINCECIGSQSPYADADMICMLLHFLRAINVRDVALELNSLGCAECRPKFTSALKDYFSHIASDELCEDCRRRITSNPLRVLDCKNERCKAHVAKAPVIADFLCQACTDHFSVVTETLKAENIAYHQNPNLVRGLDYYTRTTFEVVSTGIGSQSAVAGGGRYDGLIKALGGPDVPGIGFACGMERLAMLMEKKEPPRPDFFMAVLEPDAFPRAFALIQELRTNGLKGCMNLQPQSVKSVFRQADKSLATYCLILGSDELAQNAVTVKSMSTSSQTTIAQDALVQHLQEALKKG
ncbi:MAG: histidine--tRNA ligase [Desulfovibrionaceae bacterium]|nr:histidine--tRNA ligase [Desulfovibrionaceae bacterium]